MVSFLQSSGAISIDDLRTEWGSGGNQYNSISEFRGETWWKADDTSGTFPASGSLSFSDFYGKGPVRNPVTVRTRGGVSAVNPNNPDRSFAFNVGTNTNDRCIVIMAAIDNDFSYWGDPRTCTVGGQALTLAARQQVANGDRRLTTNVWIGNPSVTGSQTVFINGSGRGTYWGTSGVVLERVNSPTSPNATRSTSTTSGSTNTSSSLSCSDGSYVLSFCAFNATSGAVFTGWTGATLRAQAGVNEPQIGYADNVLNGSTSTGSIQAQWNANCLFSSHLVVAIR